MILHFIDQKIRQTFSNAAIQYDVLTGLHKEIGRELIKKIKAKERVEAVLDVGMGTGWLTNRLKTYFPDALVVGLDSAPGMVAAAQNNSEGFKIVQGDAAGLPFKEKSFNVIVSNLAYQWVSDLAEAFELVGRTLKPGGEFAATLFGYHTFDELFVSLQSTMEHNEAFAIERLARQNEVELALEQAGFQECVVDYEIVKSHFPDMMSLLNWVQAIGANQLKRNFYIGKDWLARAEEYYTKNFKERLGVVATFEVIWVSARKTK